MFAEEIRRAVQVTPRQRLAEISAAVWKGFAAGAVSESDAQALAEAIEARKTISAAPAQPRRVGSRPRSPESMERRRRWTSSGWLPPQLAARFTMAENAVLSVVAAQVARHARCTLALDHIAALAGVSRSTAKTALREARVLGLLADAAEVTFNRALGELELQRNVGLPTTGGNPADHLKPALRDTLRCEWSWAYWAPPRPSAWPTWASSTTDRSRNG